MTVFGAFLIIIPHSEQTENMEVKIGYGLEKYVEAVTVEETFDEPSTKEYK
jgi:hypothetical protein